MFPEGVCFEWTVLEPRILRMNSSRCHRVDVKAIGIPGARPDCVRALLENIYDEPFRGTTALGLGWLLR